MKQMNMYDILDRLNQIGADSPTVQAAVGEISRFNQVTEAGCADREPVEEKYMGFGKLEKEIAKRGDVKDPAAVAASIGRKKYGKEKFQKAAAAGRKLGEVKKPTARPLYENIESVMRAMPHEFDSFTRTGELSDKLYDVLFDIYRDDMPYGVAKARTGDPYQWITQRLHQDIENWTGRALEEADMEESNAFAYAVQKAKADGVQPGETISVGGQEYPLKESKAKPDYLDFDRDGDKKEPMKKALADKKRRGVKEQEKHPGLFRQVADRLERMVKGKDKQTDTGAQNPPKEKIDELDINLIKAAQKKSKDEPLFRKDPESERNIGKRYGYRSDADDDSDDDYDEHGNRKKKKAQPAEPGEKRGRGRPRKYTDDAPRKERVTARSRKKDRTAYTKKKVGEDYDRDESDEQGVAESVKGKVRVYANKFGYFVWSPKLYSDLMVFDSKGNLEDHDPGYKSDQDKLNAAKAVDMRPIKFSALPDRAKRVLGRTIFNQGMAEDYDRDEYDEEGEMAKTDARTIADAAAEIQAMVADNENLPEWVQKKISMAKDYLDRARDYLKANRPEGDEIMSEKALSQAQRRAAGIARAAQKGEIPKSELRGASREMAKMPAGELRKFAKTKEKGLPKKVSEEDTDTRDQRAERAGRRVAKDIEYDERVKDSIHGKRRGSEDSKAERAGRKVAKDIEHDEKVSETTTAGGIAPVMAKEQTVTHGRHKGKQWSPETPGPTNPDYKEFDGDIPSPPDGATAPPRGYKPAKPAAKPPAKKSSSAEAKPVAETDKDPTDSAGGKSKGSMQFGKGIYDSRNRELEAMIAESLSVNTSISTEGGKSVSINATEEDADRLLDILKMAGLGTESRPSPCAALDEVTENEPDYPVNPGAEQDEVYMLQKLAGGLNRPKRQVNPNNAGDNPLSMPTLGNRGSGQVNVDESAQVEQNLWNLYKRVQ